MANLVQELLIKIGIKSDIAGASQAGAAIEKIGGATQKVDKGMSAAAKSSKDLGGALGKNVEVGSQAVTLMASLEGAAKGGAAGMASAARAGLAFATMIKGALLGAGPVAIAVTAITALGAAVYGLVKAFAAPKNEVDALALALKQANDKAKEFDKASFDALKDSLKSVRDSIGETIAAYDAIAAANERVAQASDDAAKAELANMAERGVMSKERADAASKSIDARAAARGITNQTARAEFEAATVSEALRKAQGFAADPERERAAYAAEQSAITARQSEARRAAFAAEAARNEMLRESGRQYAGETPAMVATRVAEYQAKERAARRVADAAASASAEDFVAGGGRDDKESYAEFVADSLKKADEKWRAANDTVEQLEKRAEDLNAALKLRKETEDKIAQINKETEDRIKSQKPVSAKQQEIDEWKLRQVGAQALRERIASGAHFDNINALDAVLPGNKYKTPIPGSDPTAPASPAVPGLGGIIQRGGGSLPGDGQAAKGIIQRGGGSLPGDGQAAKGITQPLKDTAEAMKGADTGGDTAKAAEELKAATEQATQAQRESGEATAAALGDATAAQQQAAGEVLAAQRDTVDKLGQVVSAQNSLRSEVASLRAQVRAMRVA